MKREEKQRRTFWRWRVALIVLIMHLLLYAAIFASAIWRAFSLEILIDASPQFVSGFESQVGLALFWLPLLLIHLGVHLYLAGRSDAGKGAREAYREGFRDGAHYSEEAYTPRRLTLDEALDEVLEDDGELVEWERKRKRVER